MEKFLHQKDELAEIINVQAQALYQKLKGLKVQDLKLDAHYLEYFKSSHYKRPFFSVETSAHLLYRSILLKQKPISEIVVMDYGAGIGTLFILAKMIGCKKVIYNDLFEDWKYSAQQILHALSIPVDEYIVGDINATLKTLNLKHIECDIIASRNVIEHIYKLDVFYRSIYKYQPGALIYSSTTANFYNPATHLQHILIHRQYEKIFFQQRKEIIMDKLTGISLLDAGLLAKKTRGLGGEDLYNRLTDMKSFEQRPFVKNLYTNTCDPYHGVWAEHMISFSAYRELIGQNFVTKFEAGFWDTHYSSGLKNVMAKILNSIIRLNKTLGILLAPFIYVIAIPKHTR
jgi:2-polyprenyl-3-methyl-5-hydroxy-6-metoxy-1,4-benzoquinol methylase